MKNREIESLINKEVLTHLRLIEVHVRILKCLDWRKTEGLSLILYDLLVIRQRCSYLSHTAVSRSFLEDLAPHSQISYTSEGKHYLTFTLLQV